MAQRIELQVAPRTVMGKANKHLRKAGILPANIYGHKQAPTPIQIDAMTFDRLRRSHGTRSIISLQIENARAQTAIVRHVQREPKTGDILHIDFTRVSLRERLEVKVPMNFVGVAPGVKIQGGVFLHLLDALAVECEAADIVESVDVDISLMTEIGSVLHAKDVKLPAKYKLVTDPEEPIAKIAAPRVEVPEVVPEAVEEGVAEAPAETPKENESAES